MIGHGADSGTLKGLAVNPTRILCPVDFSDTSKHAIDLAVVVARWYTSHITALHVLTPMSLAASGFTTAAEEKREFDRLRQLTAEELAAATADGITVDVVVDVGQPAASIVDRAAKLSAGLIVMGTHGAGGFQHLLLGSVTEKVLRRAGSPVLTVPPRAHAHWHLPFRHLLCAVDFSEASLDAVRSALSLSEESRASLTLLHVLEWPWEEPPEPSIEELPREQGLALAEFRRYSEASAKKRLESLIPETNRGSRIRSTLRSGKPYVQILDVAAEERADLIVIGVHGRNPVDLTLFGSTTNQIVRQATCPVLTFRR
jgi:nucleotide-binding universal stress UspA family protein